MVKALVSGDQGFLGRHFAEELHRRGYDVVGIDTKRSPSQDCRSWFSSPAGKRHRQFDLVVHAAAVIGGRAKIDGDPLATAANLSIDAEMFRWAGLTRPGRVIYFSSSAVYPVDYQTEHGGRLLAEHAADPVNHPNGAVRFPDQVYGWSKVVGEVLADRLRAAGVPVTVVRPFSGYGADQDEDYPFPAFVRRAREGQDPFEVWCGECVRDFVHVDDIVARTLAVAQDGTTAPVNICTGMGTSFNDLAALVCRRGDRLRIRARPDMPTGVHYRVGDPARLQRLTGDLPMISLEEGVRRALET